MAPEQTKNFAVSTVATAPSPATSGTSLVVASGHGARFGDPSSQNYNAIIAPADARPTPDNSEVVRVTAKSTDTFTITRAQESSTARSVQVGDRFYAGATAKLWADQDTFNTLISAAKTDKSTLDGKGDMYAASANDTPGKLAAGTNEHVPIYDSSQTVGLKTGVPLGGLASYVPIFFAAVASRGPSSAQLVNAGMTSAGGVVNDPASNASVMLLPILASGLMGLTGRTTKLKTGIIVTTNDSSPGTFTITAGLAGPVVSTGATGTQTLTWGSAISGTTVAIANPGANAELFSISSTAYDVPADGLYVPIISTSAAVPATNPRIAVAVAIYQAHV